MPKNNGPAHKAMIANFEASFQKRFWEKVNKNGSVPSHCKQIGKCWEWTACKATTGYGQLTRRGKRAKAHRIAWELSFGEITNGLFVLHRCDNRLCCNPKHLWLGTQTQNLHDAMQKGRNARGVKNGHATLSEKIVLEIKNCLKSKSYIGMNQDLARRFDSSEAIITQIKNGYSWTHV